MVQLQVEEGNSREMPSRLWYRTDTTKYSVHGGRDILIIVSDRPLTQAEAVARRPGQLTEEDKLKLQSQGVPPECQDDLAIVKARFELDKRCKIVGVMSGQLLSGEAVKKSIESTLTTTKNDGGKILHSQCTLNGLVHYLQESDTHFLHSGQLTVY